MLLKLVNLLGSILSICCLQNQFNKIAEQTPMDSAVSRGQWRSGPLSRSWIWNVIRGSKRCRHWSKNQQSARNPNKWSSNILGVIRIWGWGVILRKTTNKFRRKRSESYTPNKVTRLCRSFVLQAWKWFSTVEANQQTLHTASKVSSAGNAISPRKWKSKGWFRSRNNNKRKLLKTRSAKKNKRGWGGIAPALDPH